MINSTPTDIMNRKKYLKGEFNNFICTMCGCKTDIDNSISHQGYNLICNDCKYKIERVIGEPIILKVHKVGTEKEGTEEGGHEE